MQNPFLEGDDLPAFSRIRPEHIEPAIDTVLAENRARLEALLNSGEPPTWSGLIAPLEAMNDRLERIWSPIAHLNAVVSSDALRVAYNACLDKLSAYAAELAQNRALYAGYLAVRDDPSYADLNTDQQYAVAHALRAFRLNGVGLPDKDKQRFAAISQRLAALGARFQDNLMDAADTWSRSVTDIAQLAGVPSAMLAVLEQDAAAHEQTGWRVSLSQPVVHAVLIYAESRTLRREVYEAWNTRASELGVDGGRYDNTPVMAEILALRAEQAQLLGYETYAELALEGRMASTPTEVATFLDILAERSVPAARAEFAELQRFAAARDGVTELAAWDVAYYAEHYRQAHYQLSPEDLRPYFPVDRVLQGLFDIAERLYGIRITATEGMDLWHPDVRFYTVYDVDGTLRAQFYTDLFARPRKRGGAWMAECRGRRATDVGVQIPVAFLTCNFTPPVADAPTLLTHEEVQTLFHEFGHGLHHMLTAVDVPSVAGIRQVPWDGVELPSQLMENWTWERDALDRFAAHFDTNGALPGQLFERLRASRSYNAGMQMARQLEFSLFDLRLHARSQAPDGAGIYALLREVREQVAVIDYPASNRFANGFQHIFAGGYAAGYYSYKWAEVLAADAYARFTEEGIFNAATGGAFREHILARGGGGDYAALFRGFRGREPSIDPLLRQHGLAP